MSSWKDQIQHLEMAPPQNAWEQIERKRKAGRAQQWGIRGTIGLGAVLLTGWLYMIQADWGKEVTEAPATNSELHFVPPTPSLPPLETTHSPQNQTPLTSSTAATGENTESESTPFGFPYNGRVVSQATPHADEETPPMANSIEHSNKEMSEEAPSVQIHPEEILKEPSENQLPLDDTFEIPNVFSPNGDGWNDEFDPAGSLPAGYQLIEWQLYQNGQFVLQFDQDLIWRGKDAGGYLMNAGMYQYQLYILTRDGNKIFRKGNISIQL